MDLLALSETTTNGSSPQKSRDRCHVLRIFVLCRQTRNPVTLANIHNRSVTMREWLLVGADITPKQNMRWVPSMLPKLGHLHSKPVTVCTQCRCMVRLKVRKWWSWALSCSSCVRTCAIISKRISTKWMKRVSSADCSGEHPTDSKRRTNDPYVVSMVVLQKTEQRPISVTTQMDLTSST